MSSTNDQSNESDEQQSDQPDDQQTEMSNKPQGKFTGRNGGETWFARFVESQYNVNRYEGPFSDRHELHAAEYGIRVGIAAAFQTTGNTPLAVAVLGLSGLKAGKDVISGGRPKFVRRNASYAVVFGVLGYFIGMGAVSISQVMPVTGGI